MKLNIPFAEIEKFLRNNKAICQQKNGEIRPVAINRMTHLTDLEILDTYNVQVRGICNYYALASNYSKLSYFVYLMEYSCLSTLAAIVLLKYMPSTGREANGVYHTKPRKAKR